MKILVLPRDANPYQSLLNGEMRRLGVQVTYLGELTPIQTLNLLLLPGAKVTAFLLAECGRVSIGSAKGRGAELRAPFLCLYLPGMTPRNLAEAVPPVAGRRDTKAAKS